MKKHILLVVILLVAMFCFVSCDDSVFNPFANEINIYSNIDLFVFSKMVGLGNSFDGKTITLTNDIDLSDFGGEWTPIGFYNSTGSTPIPFSGTFDGNNHSIKGLKISDKNYASFFACVKNGTIKNLNVYGDIKISVDEGDENLNKFNAAGIVGYTTGNVTICDCVSHVNITVDKNTKSKVGGIVAKNDGNLVISNCTNYGNISNGGIYTGGIIGDTEGYPYTVGDSTSYFATTTVVKNCIQKDKDDKGNDITLVGGGTGNTYKTADIVGVACKNANVTLIGYTTKYLQEIINYSDKKNYTQAGTIIVDGKTIYTPTT